MTLDPLAHVRHIRQSHGLEHGTVHLLIRLDPSLRLVGRSDCQGFSLYGDVDTREVARAVAEALERLQRGEGWLAVHPRCGTGTALSILLASAAACGAERLPSPSVVKRLAAVLVAIMAAQVVARPLGMAMQREVTTTTDVRGVRVREVTRRRWGGLVIHKVKLDYDAET